MNKTMIQNLALLGRRVTPSHQPKCIETVKRRALLLPQDQGDDHWTFYELLWLDSNRKPQSGVGEMVLSAKSRAIPESKSLKFFLWSLRHTIFPTPLALASKLERLLTPWLQGQLSVTIHTQKTWQQRRMRAEAYRAQRKTKGLHVWTTSCFQSFCPVTQQPDYADLEITYASLDPQASLIIQKCVASKMGSEAFHESCIDELFLTLKKELKPTHLSLWGHFTRRGGIDINPFRSTFERPRHHLPLSRQ